MKSVASRIVELLCSKVGMTPTQALTWAQTIADRAIPADEADVVALDVCRIICREEGIVLDRPRVAAIIRRAMQASQDEASRRDDKLAEVRAALLTGPRPSGRDLAEVLFAPVGKAKRLDPKPLRPSEVCQRCSVNDPRNISFLREVANAVPRRAQPQLTDAKELVDRRLSALGVPANVTVHFVTHRGRCRLHGTTAEVAGVLMRVDFGCGLVLEGELEVLE